MGSKKLSPEIFPRLTISYLIGSFQYDRSRIFCRLGGKNNEMFALTLLLLCMCDVPKSTPVHPTHLSD